MSQKNDLSERARRAQVTRRRTLFPLSPRAVRSARALVAGELHANGGYSFYAIRQILKCSPDEARGLVARAKRAELRQNLQN